MPRSICQAHKQVEVAHVMQGIISKYNISDTDLKAIMDWKYETQTSRPSSNGSTTQHEAAPS